MLSRVSPPLVVLSCCRVAVSRRLALQGTKLSEGKEGQLGCVEGSVYRSKTVMYVESQADQ